MVESIAKTLGSGSGIDLSALVTSLVDNQYQAKTAQITKREETLTAQVSAVSKLKSSMTGFSNALQTLVKGGTLTTSASSSNTGIVKATTLAGANVTGLSTNVEVRALATGQVVSTNTAIAADANPGAGSLTFQFGTRNDDGSFAPDSVVRSPIEITADDTLATIATKINATNQGVTASVIADAGGQRLVMKSATGADRAFTLTASDDAADGLKALEVGAGKTGTTIASQASDARIAVDGVEVRRAANTVSDLVPGVKLELQSAQVGTRVTIGASAPSEALRQAVNDVVDTYNELLGIVKEDTDPVSGALARDTAARDMLRSMQKLTLTDLTGKTDGSPTTLAQIGVTTNRDGTLSVDATKLNAALTSNPGAIEAMFADGGTGASGKGISAALNAITAKVTDKTYGLGASETRYGKAQSTLASEKAKAAAQRETTQTRLTQQFASMDARVAAYKSTQAFLTQQVEAWNASKS